MLNAIRVASRSSPPTAAVIIFHGLGDSGSGWRFLAEMARQSSDFDHINFVFPNSPVQPVTVNGGATMPSWFDIQSLGEYTKNDDVAGYTKALDLVKEYIDEQVQDHGIPTERIVVGGFSQGGGLSLGTVTTYDKKLGGILALSAYSPFFKLLQEKKVDVNLNTPIFHGHGTADDVVPYEAAQLVRDLFTKTLGFKDVRHEKYPGTAHGVANEELVHVFQFLQEVIPK